MIACPKSFFGDGWWVHALIEPGYGLDIVVEHVRFRVDHRAVLEG
jgi:hypothetical protein